MVVPFVRDRFTRLAYMMLAFYAYMQAALGPLMPFLRTELNLSYTMAGLHLSAFAVGMVLAGLTGDRLAGRSGRYAVFWGGGIGMAVGGIMLTLSPRVALTLVSILVMGWLGTFLLVMIQAALSDRHGEQRTIALTESNVLASMSAGLAPAMVGAFQRFGLSWRSALYMGTAALVVLFLLLRDEPIPESSRRRNLQSLNGRLPLTFWGYWLVVFFGVSVEWCMIFWGADFLISQAGFSKVSAATVMSLFFVAMVIGRTVGSWLSRRQAANRLLFIAFGTALVGFPIFWLAPVSWLNVVGLFITGLGVANFFPLTLSVAVGVAPDNIDSASARLTFAGGLAILSAPLVLGWTADQMGIFGAYSLVPLLLSGAVLVSAIANWVVLRVE